MRGVVEMKRCLIVAAFLMIPSVLLGQGFAGGANLISELQLDPALVTEALNAVADTIPSATADSMIWACDIEDYDEVYIKILCDSMSDTTAINIYSCNTSGTDLATGSPALFDRDPSTRTPESWGLDHISKGECGLALFGQLLPVGKTFAVTDVNGAFIAGKYMLVEVAPGDTIFNAKVYVLKRKH